MSDALLHSLLSQNGSLDAFGGLSLENSGTQMSWKETTHAHIFEIDLPGLTKEDVKLEVHQGTVLHVYAERREGEGGEEEEKEEEKGQKWHCRERAQGSFSRQFRLPESAKVEEIKASLRDGLLTVTVPKEEHKKNQVHHKRKKVVDISGGNDDKSQTNAPKGLGRFVCFKA